MNETKATTQHAWDLVARLRDSEARYEQILEKLEAGDDLVNEQELLVELRNALDAHHIMVTELAREVHELSPVTDE